MLELSHVCVSELEPLRVYSRTPAQPTVTAFGATAR